MIDHIKRLRRLEYIHIPLWLIKDTCWMMEWKKLGITMIFPTIFVAILITIKTRKITEFYLNLAISFWITANAFWMACEFLGHIELKHYAAIPFALGFLFTGIFYFKRSVLKQE